MLIGPAVAASAMQDFKKLRVWHLAHELSVKVIRALPVRIAREIPGLRNQAIRASASIAANIAEGCGRATRAEFLHFIEIAVGSVNELEGHLLLARDAGVLDVADHIALQHNVDLLRRMLIALLLTLQRQIAATESRSRNRHSE